MRLSRWASEPVGVRRSSGLSAWEVRGATFPPPADRLVCGCADTLTVRDRDYPSWLLRSGTWRARAYFGEHLIRRPVQSVQPVPVSPLPQVIVHRASRS